MWRLIRIRAPSIKRKIVETFTDSFLVATILLGFPAITVYCFRIGRSGDFAAVFMGILSLLTLLAGLFSIPTQYHALELWLILPSAVLIAFISKLEI